ncbi:MAG TPA: DUF4838 domain-containing protein [Chloroflexota bacterium]
MNEAPATWHTSDAPEPVRFAAAELARYLGRLVGQRLRVAEAPAGAWPALGLRAGAASSPALDRPSGAEELARRVQPVPPAFATSPGADAFLWRTGDGGASVVGTNPRSTLYGVYDLLEELGCRFFAASAEDEVVPDVGAEGLAVFLGPSRERFAQAAFAYRERHFLEPLRAPETGIDADAARREIDHAAKRRMNGFVFHIEDFAPDAPAWRLVLEELVPEIARRGLMPGLGEHGGYVLWLPPERYAAEHPEWYAQVGGRRVGTFRDDRGRYQFCTENPEALETFLGNMEHFLREHPAIQIMHVAPEDVGRWCECARCAPVPVAERYMRLDNAIAERVRRLRPDVSVTHLVYANHAELPERERPSPHLKIAFIPFGRNYAVPFTDPAANLRLGAHPWSLDLIGSWATLCRKTGAGLIEHTKAFRHRWITFRLLPLPHLEADMRWWQSIGAHGFNAPQEGEGWWVKHLNAYVYARLMWDLDAGVERLLDDYFEQYWAGIGPVVRALYQATAEALPDLSYSRNPTILMNRHPGVRATPEERWAPDAAYLEGAIGRLDEIGRRVEKLPDGVALDPSVERRLAKLKEAFEGAGASLRVSLGVRRFLLARGTARAAGALAEARAAHDRFAALQTPERLRAGTLWTGAWRRDHVFAEWEREAAATPA